MKRAVADAYMRVRNAFARSAAGRWWRYDCTLVVYRLDRADYTADEPPETAFARNCRAHFARYVAEGRYVDRASFLRLCEERIAAGEQVYTVCPGERLLAYAWLVPNQASSRLTAVARDLRYPPRSCVLYNAYTEPEARGRGYNTLLARARVADAFLRHGADSVFTSIEPGNVHAARAKLAVGFRPWLELSLRTRWGRNVQIERSLAGAGPASQRPLSVVAPGTPPGIGATAGNRVPSLPGT